MIAQKEQKTAFQFVFDTVLPRFAKTLIEALEPIQEDVESDESVVIPWWAL
jgi:hypothetical protein